MYPEISLYLKFGVRRQLSFENKPDVYVFYPPLFVAGIKECWTMVQYKL